MQGVLIVSQRSATTIQFGESTPRLHPPCWSAIRQVRVFYWTDEMVKCRKCESEDVSIEEKHGQDVVRCNQCQKWSHNASRTETGRKARTVSTTHEAIRASVRAEVLSRATGRCEMCGAAVSLTVGHLVSVRVGHDYGLTDDEINSQENLCAMCDECNSGLGATPVPLRLAISMIRKRIERGAK